MAGSILKYHPDSRIGNVTILFERIDKKRIDEELERLKKL
jgi:hypothetical protein